MRPPPSHATTAAGSPFPFTAIFQNGPRRPRVSQLRRAKSARPGPLRAVPKTSLRQGKGGKSQRQNHFPSQPSCCLPLVGPQQFLPEIPKYAPLLLTM